MALNVQNHQTRIGVIVKQRFLSFLHPVRVKIRHQVDKMLPKRSKTIHDMPYSVFFKDQSGDIWAWKCKSIFVLSLQIPVTCVLSSVVTQDTWQKDRDDSLNVKLWQHIWGSVYKAVWGIRRQQTLANILPRTCGRLPGWLPDIASGPVAINAENAELPSNLHTTPSAVI